MVDVSMEDADKIDTFTADDQGRVTLGKDQFANATVKIAAKRVDDD